MQKPNSRDLWRAVGWTLGTAGILFAVGISAKIPLDQLLTPTAIAIMLVVGFAVSAVDLAIVLRDPERLAIARGEKMPAADTVQHVRDNLRKFATLNMWAALVGCSVIIIVLAALALSR